MSTSLLSALIYLLGFVGLASIGLLPLRSWQVLREALKSSSLKQRKAFVILAVLIAAGALWSDVQTTTRIFKCLTQNYCGPGVASGWSYLAMLGAVYLAFEAVIYVMQKKISRVKAPGPLSEL